jgi:hypothetical protein
MFAKNDKYNQGLYKPINSKKYKGGTYAVYRSGYELKFFRWCDTNSRVLEWGSENYVVPYLSPLDGRYHRYFVDNYVKLQIGENKTEKYLIEIKPYIQTFKPEKGNKRNSTFLYEAKTYVTNQAKWDAAKAFCDKKGFKFLILTEKELNI